MSAITGQLSVLIWFVSGGFAYWYMLDSEAVDLYEFYGCRCWYLGAAIVGILGPLSIPIHRFITRRKK